MAETSSEYVFPPAAASSKEVLETKPNKAADATSGPDDQVSQTGYVTWTRPDGGTFIAPVANSETYERKGYKKGAEQDIPDIVAWNAENAATEPAKPEAEAKTATTKAPAEKT